MRRAGQTFIGQEVQRTHWAGHQLPVQSLCPSQHILHAQLHCQFIDVLQEGKGQVHACILLMEGRGLVLWVQGPARRGLQDSLDCYNFS